MHTGAWLLVAGAMIAVITPFVRRLRHWRPCQQDVDDDESVDASEVPSHSVVTFINTNGMIPKVDIISSPMVTPHRYRSNTISDHPIHGILRNDREKKKTINEVGQDEKNKFHEINSQCPVVSTEVDETQLHTDHQLSSYAETAAGYAESTDCWPDELYKERSVTVL